MEQFSLQRWMVLRPVSVFFVGKKLCFISACGTGCEEFQAKLNQLRRVEVMYWTFFLKEAALLCPRRYAVT